VECGQAVCVHVADEACDGVQVEAAGVDPDLGIAPLGQLDDFVGVEVGAEEATGCAEGVEGDGGAEASPVVTLVLHGILEVRG